MGEVLGTPESPVARLLDRRSSLPLMASGYQPLGAYLPRQPGLTCVLTFREIEAFLGRPLPPVASTRRSW